MSKLETCTVKIRKLTAFEGLVEGLHFARTDQSVEIETTCEGSDLRDKVRLERESVFRDKARTDER